MKDSEYAAVKIFEQIRRYAFVIPLCIVLTILSVFPISYGLANKESVLTMASGLIFIGSLITLIIWAIRENRLHDKMLRTSAVELAEIEEGLSLLKKPSVSNLLH